jgi:hypothetical protein
MWGPLRRIYFVFDRRAQMTIHYRERYNIDFGRARALYYFEILSHAPLTSSAGGLCRRAAAKSVTRRTINHPQSGREWKKKCHRQEKKCPPSAA